VRELVARAINAADSAKVSLSELFGFWRTFGEAVECPCVAFGAPADQA
jgi:hypothetical protein